MEWLRGEQNLPKNITSDVLDSTDLSGAPAREVKKILSVASPEPYIVKGRSDPNKPEMSYNYGRRHPVMSANLNDLNLPRNLFNVMILIFVAPGTKEQP